MMKIINMYYSNGYALEYYIYIFIFSSSGLLGYFFNDFISIKVRRQRGKTKSPDDYLF